MQKQINYEEADYTTITELIARTVANLDNTPIEELPPIYNSVEADAVDQLFQHDQSQVLKLQFQYHGFLITIDSAGTITFEQIS